MLLSFLFFSFMWYIANMLFSFIRSRGAAVPPHHCPTPVYLCWRYISKLCCFNIVSRMLYVSVVLGSSYPCNLTLHCTDVGVGVAIAATSTVWDTSLTSNPLTCIVCLNVCLNQSCGNARIQSLDLHYKCGMKKLLMMNFQGLHSTCYSNTRKKVLQQSKKTRSSIQLHK